MTEFIQELGMLADRGPICISIIAFIAFGVMFKWTISFVRETSKESNERNKEFAESITQLSSSMNTFSETDREMKAMIIKALEKIGIIDHTVHDISDAVQQVKGDLTGVQTKIVFHEARINKLEKHE